MSLMVGTVRRYSTAVCGLVLVAAAWGFARLPMPTTSERSAMAARFRFARLPAPEAPHEPYRYIRNVHPSLKRIAAWISSVGAAVALADAVQQVLDLLVLEPGAGAQFITVRSAASSSVGWNPNGPGALL